ncbi:MAG: hypothetical protein ABW321_20520 [Polyangiales bacterium]
MAMIAPARVAAFTDPTLFGEFPSEMDIGGGGGRYFSGSPADGYGCSVCHTSASGYQFPLYVQGLPMNGYIPGTPYNITLSWPEAAAFTAASAQQVVQKPVPGGGVVPTNLSPRTALTAEFVAEDGGDSGTLELPPLSLTKVTDTCTPPPGETLGPLGGQIFAARRGVEAQRITANEEKCSTNTGDDARCIVALPGTCGSSTLQVRWTAPPRWRGPIWFSAGFVTTGDATSIPNDNDFVTEVTIPINGARDDARYDTVVESGCSTSGAVRGRTSSPLGLFAVVAGLGLLGLRARRRAARHPAAVSGKTVMWLGLLALLGISCDEATPRPGSDRPELIGAFEPSDKLDSGMEAAVIDVNPCVQPLFPESESDAGTEPGGTLMISYTTAPPPGVMPGQGDYDYEKGQMLPNYGIIWIEDAMSRYVGMVEYWFGQYAVAALVNYFRIRAGACSDPPMDVRTGATLSTHQMHMPVWDSRTDKGSVVPYGNYVLRMEVQIDEIHPAPLVDIPFTTGPEPWTMTLPDQPPVTGLTLTYTPNK